MFSTLATALPRRAIISISQIWCMVSISRAPYVGGGFNIVDGREIAIFSIGGVTDWIMVHWTSSCSHRLAVDKKHQRSCTNYANPPRFNDVEGEFLDFFQVGCELLE